MKRVWRILSLDGGGIRGLIPATVLQRIESKTGKSISDLFDIIAGTSTGGILALGLTKPDYNGRPVYSAEALKFSYLRYAGQIFANPASWWENLLRPKYRSAAGIERVMQSQFGDTRLSQAITDIVIPCYDIEQRVPHIFKSRWARCQRHYDMPMSSVARAASATPTLFEPLRVSRPEIGDYLSLVDGGVFANNPALLGYAEINAMRAKPGDEFLVVSLGTGESMEKLEKKYIADWGYVRWSIPMIELVSESNSEAVHEQMRYIMDGSNTQNYYRFQVDLPDEVYYPLDNPSSKNMQGLLQAADALFEDPQTESELTGLCKRLNELYDRYGSGSSQKGRQNGAAKPAADSSAAVISTSTAGGARNLAEMAITQSAIDARVPESERLDLQRANIARSFNSSDADKSWTSAPAPAKQPVGSADNGPSEPLATEDSHYQFIPPLSPQPNKFQLSLCYAIEDYQEVVQPLAAALAERGVTVHFENFGLPSKESMRRLISRAAETTLINCVVLSPALLHNQWSAKQLQWLYKRTLSGKNVILPVVHGYTRADIPILLQHVEPHWQDGAGRYLEYLTALAEGSTAGGIDKLATRIDNDLQRWFS